MVKKAYWVYLNFRSNFDDILKIAQEIITHGYSNCQWTKNGKTGGYPDWIKWAGKKIKTNVEEWLKNDIICHKHFKKCNWSGLPVHYPITCPAK